MLVFNHASRLLSATLGSRLPGCGPHKPRAPYPWFGAVPGVTKKRGIIGLVSSTGGATPGYRNETHRCHVSVLNIESFRGFEVKPPPSVGTVKDGFLVAGDDDN